ncbi:MAG: ABC transporter substrate-binding protein, partial [Actinomycetota bacterium]
MVALLVVACTSGAEPSSTTTTTMPTTTTVSTTTLPPTTTTTTEPRIGNPYGGVAIVADDQEPPTLNPFVEGGDNFIVSIIGQAYFTGVYEIDGRTLEFIPEVVTELPTVSNGGVVVNDDGTMTVHYTIRDEAVWEDGVPISGDDFAFTLKILQDPAYYTGLRENPYEDVVSLEATPKTFSYTMSQPTIQYEQFFRVLVPQHAVEGSDFLVDWNEKMWPSGGPFRFSTWQKRDRIVVE